MSNKEKFYITAAITYTSQKPHIGNTYDPVLCDAISRHKRMLGYDTYFVAGTDEHGLKIEQEAKKRGITIKEYVDEKSKMVRDIWDLMNVDYQYFVRTTDENHMQSVQSIFKKMYEQDDIYKGSYEGKYCVPCESFLSSSQLVDGKCPDCARPVEDAKEEAYFFRLSKYQDKLMAFYDENPDFFLPASRKNEMINNFFKPGLQDLCVSRTSFKWGIPVDFDTDHVVYVWLDALTSYITALGYQPDSSSEIYKKYWPADVHVIGKDIMRFHSIYWPAFLMSLGEPLPKQILGHPWLLIGDDKMSKSVGNVIYADDLVRYLGVDAVRYFLLTEIPFSHDGSITYENIILKYNSDLANTLGNLVNRTVAMTNKYFEGKVSKPLTKTALDDELINFCKNTTEKYLERMESYHNSDAVSSLLELASRCNKYIDETTPWILAKDDEQKSRLNDVLYNLLECIRSLGILYGPAMPETSVKILDQLGVSENQRDLPSIAVFGTPDSYHASDAVPLFARLDAEKLLLQIESEVGSPESAQPGKKASDEQLDAQNVVFLPEISIDDFMKIDLRVARIITCENIKKSKKLLKLTLDDGSESPRTVCSGIAPWYKPENLIGKHVIVVANLKPAVLLGTESQGMILAADNGDAVSVIFVDEMAPGSKVR